MEKKKRKLSKGKIRAIIIAAVTAAIVIALIITNFFVPVKYLSSYMVVRNKGADEGVMRVRFVDVGFGDCTIVELPDGKNMLVDGGNGTAVNEKRILKFLNMCDIDTIDYLVCTSVNSEHCGGLAEICKYKKVKRIYMPYCKNTYVTDEYRKFTLAKGSTETVTIEYGVGEVNDESGYFFTFLSPSVRSNPESEYNSLGDNPTKAQLNCISAVMWLEYAGTGFLFAGDAPNEVLTKICNSYEMEGENYALCGGHAVNLGNCSVVLVAAHGSKDSACAPLYDIMKPKTAVISVGKNGSGCPSMEALSDAINYVGENLYRTDDYGTVTIQATKDGYAVV